MYNKKKRIFFYQVYMNHYDDNGNGKGNDDDNDKVYTFFSLFNQFALQFSKYKC